MVTSIWAGDSTFNTVLAIFLHTALKSHFKHTLKISVSLKLLAMLTPEKQTTVQHYFCNAGFASTTFVPDLLSAFLVAELSSKAMP